MALTNKENPLLLVENTVKLHRWWEWMRLTLQNQYFEMFGGPFFFSFILAL